MRIEDKKYILENQIELNNPAFLNITFSDSYLTQRVGVGELALAFKDQMTQTGGKWRLTGRG
jgi:hypothetical protein